MHDRFIAEIKNVTVEIDFRNCITQIFHYELGYTERLEVSTKYGQDTTGDKYFIYEWKKSTFRRTIVIKEKDNTTLVVLTMFGKYVNE